MLLTGAARPVLRGPERPADGDRRWRWCTPIQHQHLPELGPRASLSLHRPQRRDQHPARQHQLDARPPGADWKASLFGEDIQKAQAHRPNGSDSAMFDNVLELLVLAGRSLPHAMMMMIPEPWSGHESMDAEARRLLRVPQLPHGTLGRPGFHGVHRRHAIGAVLDRNGLRPSRYYVTKDDLVIMASRGRRAAHPARGHVKLKGRLQPGRMFLVDTEQGRIVPTRRSSNPSQRTLRRVAEAAPGQARGPAGWHRLPGHQTTRRCCSASSPLATPSRTSASSWSPMATRRRRGHRLHGHGHAARRALEQTEAALRLLQAALCAGHEPAHRLHPRGDRHLSDVWLGAEGNLLEPKATDCRRIELKGPVLTNEEFAKVRRVALPGLKVGPARMLFRAARGEEGLVKAMEEMCAEAKRLIEEDEVTS
jgi:hypothetical protein